MCSVPGSKDQSLHAQWNWGIRGHWDAMRTTRTRTPKDKGSATEAFAGRSYARKESTPQRSAICSTAEFFSRRSEVLNAATSSDAEKEVRAFHRASRRARSHFAPTRAGMKRQGVQWSCRADQPQRVPRPAAPSDGGGRCRAHGAVGLRGRELAVQRTFTSKPSMLACPRVISTKRKTR